ncbi:hypothetical protein BXZ70DRAFT_186789 [Cristinia sonorae]|uniref:DUF6593 domain-containing protein n=1 Tax=Cristinia sonorae TaxID=1940300 RepID=A0A8K0UML2_9AGAR|nr:hypothetical protein BXZ70DRAFT_186789 [Cristinia sonorae]
MRDSRLTPLGFYPTLQALDMSGNIRFCHPPGCRELDLSEESFLNATLIDAKTEETIYSIRTDSSLIHGMRTTLVATHGRGTEEVAYITKGAVLHSDRIVFRGEEPMKLKDWMHKSTFTDPEQSMGNGLEKVRCTWDRVPNSPRTIALTTSHHPEPVAWYYPSVRSTNPPMPATLAIHPDGFAMQDTIVASLMVLVQMDKAVNSRFAEVLPFMVSPTASI